MPNLNCGDVGVLRDVLVLVQCFLRKLALLLLDGQLCQQEHHRLQGCNGHISRPLRGDVIMENTEGRRSLVDPDEFLSPLQDIFGLLVGRRRLQSIKHR